MVDFVGRQSARANGTATAGAPDAVGAQAGDRQVLAVSTFAGFTITPGASWTLVNSGTANNVKLAVYTRVLDASMLASTVPVSISNGQEPVGIEVRTYRDAGRAIFRSVGAGATAPTRDVVSGTLLRLWASGGSGSDTLTPPAAMENATPTQSFSWWGGVVAGDDPTAAGAEAPTRTATGTITGALWADVELLLASEPATYVIEVLTDSPLGYWRLGELSGTTATDSSGSSRDGAYVSSPTLGEAGVLSDDDDTAMSVTGGSRVDVAAAAWMRTGTFTVEAWVKPSTISGDAGIVARHNGPDNLCWDLGRIGSSIFWRTKNRNTNEMYTASAPSGTLAVGKWTHLVGTYDGANLRVYVNGALVGTTAAVDTYNIQNNPPLSIGALSENYASFPFAGTIDEVSYYDTALSATRIAAHYAAGAGYDFEVLADAPWGYWRNNETSGTTLADSSGNSRPMTTSGVVTLNQPGPVTGMSSVEYQQGSDTSLARTDATTGLFGSAACTLETWVYVPSAATMGRSVVVATMSEATSSALVNLMIGFETDGRIIAQNNAAQIAGPVLSRNTWYHVVASVGAAGLKLRVNKVTEASNTGQTSTGTTGYAVFQRREKNSTGSGSDYRTQTQVRIGPTSIYSSQLSDTRTDAHYDASGYVPPRTASLTGVGEFTATAVVVPQVTGTIEGRGAFSARAIRGDMGPNLHPDPQYTGPGEGAGWWWGTKTSSLPEGLPGYTSGAYVDNTSTGSGAGFITAGTVVRPAMRMTAGAWVRVVSDTGWDGHAVVKLAMVTDHENWTDYDYVTPDKTVQEADGWTWVEWVVDSPAADHLWPSMEFYSWVDTVGPGGGKVRVYATGVEIRQQVDAVVTGTVAGQGEFTATASVVLSVTGSLDGVGEFTATASIPLPAPVLVGQTLPAAEGVASDVTTNVPSGTQAGDVMLWFIRTRQPSITGTGENFDTVPSGWTRVKSASANTGGTGTSDIGLALYRRTATASEPASYTAAPFGAGYQQGAMFVYRDAAIVGSAVAWSPDLTSGTQSHQTAALTLTEPVSNGDVLTVSGCGFSNTGWVSSDGTALWTHATSHGRRKTGVTATGTYTPGAMTHSDEWVHKWVTVNVALAAAAAPPPSVAAELAGEGAFTATAVVAVTAPLAGEGAFTATAQEEAAVSASLTGVGEFTATVAAVDGVMQVAANLVGIGEFTATTTSWQPAPAYLLILTPQVQQPPSALTAVMANLEPLVEVTFAIDGVMVGTEFTDANGDILEIVLPVDRQFGAGTHELTGTTATQTAAATFTVLVDPNALPTIPAPDDPPVLVEPPVNDVYRWVFQDAMPGGLGSWVMPINPTTMSNPHVRKTLAQASTTAVRGSFHIGQGATPVDWEFAGFAPDKAFQDKLLAYAELPYRFYIIDHRGRAWTVAIVNVDIKPRNRVLSDQGQPQDWLADYAVKVALFSQMPTVPVLP